MNLVPPVKEAAVNKGPSIGELFAKTSAIGVASSATGVLIGAGLGSLSNNLLGVLLPGALIGNLLFPPIVTVLGALLMGNWEDAGRFSFWWPVLGAFLVNAAVYVVTSLAFSFAVAWTNPVSLLLYALVDGVLMAGATTGIMALTERKNVSTVQSFVPGVSDTTFVAVSKWEF